MKGIIGRLMNVPICYRETDSNCLLSLFTVWATRTVGRDPYWDKGRTWNVLFELQLMETSTNKPVGLRACKHEFTSQKA